LRIENTWTAVVTPFLHNEEIDWDGYNKNIEFQINEGIEGIVAVGTTGESPTLNWKEHNEVIEKTISICKNRTFVLAGTGSNSTKEAIENSKHAEKAGSDAVLLVDCYYNGPSSAELRDEYYNQVAKSINIECVPYIIPGRTGTSLAAEDLALLHYICKNVNTVKEATGNLDNMKRIRKLCGEDFSIMSGDDSITCKMIIDSKIKANGAISVISNIAPKAVSSMIKAARWGDIKEAERLDKALSILSNIVVVTVQNPRKTPFEQDIMVSDRYRNPLPIKVIMNVLGMPSGPSRKPLGKMSVKGLSVIREALSFLITNNPEILIPINDFYEVDIYERINDDSIWNGLVAE